MKRIRDTVKVFILGNHKTGSTASAASLAELTDSAVTLDIRGAIRNPKWKVQLSRNIGTFDDFIYENRRELRRPIIKDPVLTLFYEDLKNEKL